MTFGRRLPPTLLLAATVLSAPLAAQERPGIDVTLPNTSRLTVEGPLVRARRMLDDAPMREALESGFPVRLPLEAAR